MTVIDTDSHSRVWMEKTVANMAGREEEELALGGTRVLYCTHGPRAPALNKINCREERSCIQSHDA